MIVNRNLGPRGPSDDDPELAAALIEELERSGANGLVMVLYHIEDNTLNVLDVQHSSKGEGYVNESGAVFVLRAAAECVASIESDAVKH